MLNNSIAIDCDCEYCDIADYGDRRPITEEC